MLGRSIMRRSFSSSGGNLNKTFLVGLIPADGIGKEVVPACKAVLDAVDSPFKYVELKAGFELFQKTGEALPQKTLDTLRECHGSIFGAVSSPSHKVEGYSSPIVRIRKELDLYANIRPVLNASEHINMVIVRENTECLYVKRESIETLADGTKSATAIRVITEKASTRIGEMAFKIARQRMSENHKSVVTIVHKSNVMSITDGLFRESVLEVAKRPENADIEVNEQLVDSMVYRMFREPHAFDVCVAPNLYGDIISDGAAALVGSLGLVPSTNSGEKHIMAEPVHGSAPDIMGKGIANPIACIRSGAMLLEGFGEIEKANRIYAAVNKCLENGVLTPDLGGHHTTREVVREVIQNLS